MKDSCKKDEIAQAEAVKLPEGMIMTGLDHYVTELRKERSQMPEYQLREGEWICECGRINNRNFCEDCGRKKH